MGVLKMLEIALGMSVVYLLFALAVTALNEAIAAGLSSRARWMRRGVKGLLSDTTKNVRDASANARVKAFYASPYVAYLGRDTGRYGSFLTSYIPAWTLVQGVLDSVRGELARDFASVEQVLAAAQHLPANAPLRAVLEDLCAQAGGSLALLKEGVERWYGGFEQQVISWYRQKTHAMILLLALLVAAAGNVDSIALARQMSIDPKLRAQAVDIAIDQATEPRGEPEPDTTLTLSAAGLQLGWGPADLELLAAPLAHVSGWVEKILGLIMTAAALSLGAPFWFDLLKRLASIRSVGLNFKEHEAEEQKTGK